MGSYVYSYLVVDVIFYSSRCEVSRLGYAMNFPGKNGYCALDGILN